MGDKLNTFAGHTDVVSSVAFSPDGSQVLTGSSRDKSAILWDAATVSRSCARSLEIRGSVTWHSAQTGAKSSLAHWTIPRFCGTQRRDQNPHFRGPYGSRGLRDFQSRRAKRPDRVYGRHDRSVLECSYGESGRRFVPRPQILRRSVAFSPDNRKVLTTSDEMDPILWDAATGDPQELLIGHDSSVHSLHFTPDGHRWIRANPPFFPSRSARTAVDCLLDQMTILPPCGTRRLKRTADIGRAPGRSDFYRVLPRWAHVLTGSHDNTAIFWDVATGTKLHTLVGHLNSVKSVAISPDGAMRLTGSTDDTVRLWDLAAGTELLSLVSRDQGKDWLAFSPEGLFDGSQGGQSMSYRLDGRLQVVPVERFFQDFYRPGLLAEIMRGERPLPEVKLGQNRPPQLKIATPQSGNITTQELTIAAEAVDKGAGVSKLAIYQNGARVLAAGETRQDGKTVYRTFKIALVEGKNRIRITAASADGSWESEPAEITLNYAKPLAKSHLYIVAVGINRYADANLNLNFAGKDAAALAELFRQRGAALYEQVHVTQLVDDQATKAGIEKALEMTAAETKPQDTFLLFLAGHGAMVGQRYYLFPTSCDGKPICWTMTCAAKACRPTNSRITSVQPRRLLQADHDSRHLRIGGRTGHYSEKPFRVCISRGRRASVAQSGRVHHRRGRRGRRGEESKELGHGVLSYALLAGLRGIDRGPLEGKFVQTNNPDRVVDVLEWFTFAAGQVPRLTEKLYGQPQDVQTSTQGGSFPVLPLGD